jgi:hypothetical protein
MPRNDEKRIETVTICGMFVASGPRTYGEFSSRPTKEDDWAGIITLIDGVPQPTVEWRRL